MAPNLTRFSCRHIPTHLVQFCGGAALVIFEALTDTSYARKHSPSKLGLRQIKGIGPDLL